MKYLVILILAIIFITFTSLATAFAVIVFKEIRGLFSARKYMLAYLITCLFILYTVTVLSGIVIFLYIHTPKLINLL